MARTSKTAPSPSPSVKRNGDKGASVDGGTSAGGTSGGPAPDRIVLVVEATAVAASAWPGSLVDFVEPLLAAAESRTRSSLSAASASSKEASSSFRSPSPGKTFSSPRHEFALVCYRSWPPFAPAAVTRSPWTSDVARFRTWLSRVRFAGGGGGGTGSGGSPPLAPALAAVGRLFRTPLACGAPPGDCRRHVLLLPASEPHRGLVPWPHSEDAGRCTGMNGRGNGETTAPGVRVSADEALLGVASRGATLSLVLPPVMPSASDFSAAASGGAAGDNNRSQQQQPAFAKRLISVFVAAERARAGLLLPPRPRQESERGKKRKGGGEDDEEDGAAAPRKRQRGEKEEEGADAAANAASALPPSGSTRSSSLSSSLDAKALLASCVIRSGRSVVVGSSGTDGGGIALISPGWGEADKALRTAATAAAAAAQAEAEVAAAKAKAEAAAAAKKTKKAAAPAPAASSASSAPPPPPPPPAVPRGTATPSLAPASSQQNNPLTVWSGRVVMASALAARAGATTSDDDMNGGPALLFDSATIVGSVSTATSSPWPRPTQGQSQQQLRLGGDLVVLRLLDLAAALGAAQSALAHAPRGRLLLSPSIPTSLGSLLLGWLGGAWGRPRVAALAALPPHAVLVVSPAADNNNGVGGGSGGGGTEGAPNVKPAVFMLPEEVASRLLGNAGESSS